MTENKENNGVENSSSMTYCDENLSVMDTGRFIWVMSESTSMSQNRYSPTESLGMNAVEQVFIEMGWIKRTQLETDVGIDLHVEQCHDSEPTGRLLALQVKSGKSFWDEADDVSVTFRFDQTHYDYWMKYSLPVLVAIYHPETKKILWEHITPTKCISTGKGWKVRIPWAQELTTQSGEQLGLIAKKPTLPDVIKTERERIESIDPRFKVRIEASEEGTHVLLEAKEDVKFNFQMTGSEERLAEMYTDLVDKGRPVTFEKAEIRFDGLPILDNDRDHSDGKVTIQAASKMPVLLALVAITASQKEETRIDSIPGELTRGRKNFSVSAALPNSPLSITMEGDNHLPGSKGVATLRFCIGSWCGTPLLSLPYFDQIDRLFEALRNGAKLSFECYFEGNKQFSSDAVVVEESFGGWIRYVNILGKARFIAKTLELTPNLPSLSSAQLNEIEILYKLLQKGEVTTNVSDFRCDFKHILSSELLSTLEMKSEPNPFPIELDIQKEEPERMPFLGLNVKVPLASITATSVVLSNRDAVKRELASKDGDKEVKLVFEGTNHCKLIRKLK